MIMNNGQCDIYDNNSKREDGYFHCNKCPIYHICKGDIPHGSLTDPTLQQKYNNAVNEFIKRFNKEELTGILL